jgi:Tir chaperone protein (CesT) family
MKNFHDLIHELGDFLGEELSVDLNQTCFLEINELIKVQIELDSAGEKILLLSKIIELPPGRFRENVLKDGLKANFLAEEKSGILSYLERQNQLVIFEDINTHSITMEILYQHLLKFIERAIKWATSIEAGRSSPDAGEIPEGSTKKGSPFGFK